MASMDGHHMTLEKLKEFPKCSRNKKQGVACLFTFRFYVIVITLSLKGAFCLCQMNRELLIHSKGGMCQMH